MSCQGCLQEQDPTVAAEWMLPYSEELGPPKGLIPLMAVVQKQKVRVGLDYG